MAAAKQKEITTRRVDSIQFGMYTDEEVRKLSVQRITSPLTYDNLNNIVSGGLYDPALGPVDQNARCKTCGLNYNMCPGHFGHIELPVVVYNPLVFSMLYRLLKHTCLNCHQFKMGRGEMSKFLVKFSCLSRGDLVAASLIHTAQAAPSGKALDDVMSATPSKPPKPSGTPDSSAKAKKAQQKAADDAEEAEYLQYQQQLGADGDLGTGLGAYEAAYGEKGSAKLQQMPKTLHIQDAMRILTQEFYKRMPGTKCHNCGCLNPSIKKQGSSKVFKQYSRRALLQNFTRGIDVAAAVTGGAAAAVAAMARIREADEAADSDSEDVELDDKKGAGKAGASAEGGKKRKRAADAGEQAQKKQGLVGEAYEGKSAPVPAAIKKQQQEQEDWVIADESSEEEEQKGAATKAAKAGSPVADAGTGKPLSKAKAAEAAVAQQLGRQINLDEACKPKYMTPDEVEGHMRQLCYNESGILQHLFGGDKPSPSAAADSSAAALPRSRKKRKQLQQQQQLEKALDQLRQYRLQQHYSVLKDIHPELGAAAEEGLAAQRRRARKGVTAAARAGPADMYKAFFLKALAVPPNRFRPPSVMGDQKFEHTQNITLQRILQAVINLQSIHQDLDAVDAQQAAAGQAMGLSAKDVAQIAAERRLQAQQRFMAGWLKLQNEVNALIDSTAADNSDQSGVRQQLEKKEGLFRMNMMGKRVNYAARSVISPDPYIGAGEIGVPPYFAMRLSFPEAVTPHNVEHLRQLVRNGAHKYPGALAVEDCTGRVIQLSRLEEKQREALAKQLMLPSFTAGVKQGPAGRGKTVYRMLLDGDVMLTNRQPTLHKPSLMAHKARVLKGERTIRMHYANCSSFNADFDGDEINLHLPQDHLGRAEGYNIVHADRQFIVPTDGKPIRGLIQDHVVAGVELTCRDCFLTRDEFSQLLFAACTPWKPGRAPAIHLTLPPPAVLRPRQLWTGKQLVSAVVEHFTDGRPALTFSSGSKVPVSYWGVNSDEGEFIFHKGQLLAGCMDKAQFGKFGLVHAMQELYGDEVGGAMLNALSRLFTSRLQATGFTCGMDDLLLTQAAEAGRSKVLGKAEAAALAGSAEVVRSTLVTAGAIASGRVPVHLAQKPGGKVSGLLNAERLMVAKQLEQHFSMNGAATGAVLDSKVTGVMHPLASEVIKGCIPRGQRKPFPANCMSLMTVSGAKGSTVNFSQIACLLGQQELEGRRVPRTASGKTLPCFRAYDGGARAGGFVGDRFLTGLRPQEYYFHCMAGREGLVDTTVKTSRSGYLQRCLVKNLESLRISYDGTVRDVCDGSVVQLHYGDDGLDVTKVSYMKQTEFMAANASGLAHKLGLNVDPQQQQDAAVATDGSSKKKRKQQLSQLQTQLQELGLFDKKQADIATAVELRQQLLRKAAGGDEEAEKQLQEQLPLMARWFSSAMGATSERFSDALERFCAAPPKHLLLTAEASAAAADVAAAMTALKAVAAEAEGGSKKARKKQVQLLQELLEKQLVVAESRMAQVDPQDFRWLQQLKFMSALAAPGEAVGVLAAQSVGEPSTQMTLNTFHMAGRGEANVTLGIPRLREILMTAAAQIKTPTMTVPLLPGCDPAAAKLLTARMRRLKLAETLKGIKVWERPAIAVTHLPTGEKWAKGYDLQLRFYDIQQYPQEAEISWGKLQRCLTDTFMPNLLAALKRQLKKQAGRGAISSASVTGGAEAGPGSGGDGDADDEEGGEGAAISNRGADKQAAAGAEDDEDRPDEAAEDEEADEELREGKLRFRGGREEGATYDEPDEDDAEIAAAVDAEMRERLSESDESSDAEDDADDSTPNKTSDKSNKQLASSEGEDDEQTPPPPPAAAAKASGRKSQQRQQSADTAGAAGGYGKGSVVRNSMGGKKPDDPLLNFVISEDTRSCNVEVIIPMHAPRILMLEVAEQVAALSLVSHLPGIQAVHLLDPERPGQPQRLQTEGINFAGLWAQQQLLDVDKLACNDVHAMLTTYGVEAARATILKEVQSVFGAYGIGVDPRHLGLIADFMTHTGGYRACNRLGIDSTTSPLLKMTFETAAKFLTDAALTCGSDSLTSPAARLVVGAVTEVGTGCCQLLHEG